MALIKELMLLLAAICLLSMLSACGGGGNSSAGSSVSGTYTATSGVAQKGPLIKGSTVTAQELDASLSPTGKQYTFQVSSDLGTFSPTSAFGSRYIGLTATGYYFDEVQGGVSAGTITLNGVSDLGSGSVLNVNLLTTLAYQRILHLVTVSHLSVPGATVQAEDEVLAALHIPGGSSYGSFGSLDLSQGADGDRILAAVSSLFVYGNSSGQLASLIANFQSDIADNGVIDSTTTQAALTAAGKGLNPATVAANLTSAYASQGLSFSASDISAWIDQSGDGVVGKFRFQAPVGVSSDTYTLPAAIVAELAGETVSVSGAVLAVNGVVVSSATLQAGDTVTVSSAGSAVNAYLQAGGINVAEVSLTPPTVPGTLPTDVAQPLPTSGLALLAGSGGGPGNLDGTGAAASFGFPFADAVDGGGNVYVVDSRNASIRKVTSAGVVTTLATGITANGIAVSSSGTLFVTDAANNTIDQISPAGVVTTFAGTAHATSSSCQMSDGSGTSATFCNPWGIALDASGNLYVTEKNNNAVRKITSGGLVSTLTTNVVAGTVTQVTVSGPTGLVVDGSGNVFVTDSGNSVILKITASGTVSTFAGTAYLAQATPSSSPVCQWADGTGTAARFCNPNGIAIDAQGNLYVSELGNDIVRKITPSAQVTTLAGTAGVDAGEDGAGGNASFVAPRGVAVDGNGNVFVAESGGAVRKVTPTGTVSTLAGWTEQNGSLDGTSWSARFESAQAVVVDTQGNSYVADSSSNTIRKITPAGVVTTVAGTAYNANGATGPVCQMADGTGTAARFCVPTGIAIDGSSNLYVEDSGNGRIRKITTAGEVTTLVSGLSISSSGIAIDSSGTVYAGSNGNLVKVSVSGVISTLATGVIFNGIAVNSAGTVYVSTASYSIVSISPTGVVSPLAGGTQGSADGTGSAAQFNFPLMGLALDGSGNLLVADRENHAIRKITPAGVVSTVVGSASSFGLRLGALPGSLSQPEAVAVTPNGNLVIINNGDGVLTTTSGGF